MNTIVSTQYLELKRQALWTVMNFCGYTIKAFDEKIGYRESHVKDIVNGSRTVSDDSFLKMIKSFGIGYIDFNNLKAIDSKYVYLEKETKKLVISYATALLIIDKMKKGYKTPNTMIRNVDEIKSILRNDPNYLNGRVMKMAREAYGLNQTLVADVVGINRREISSIENGSSLKSYLYEKEILSVYGLTSDDLKSLAFLYLDLKGKCNLHELNCLMKCAILKAILQKDEITKEAETYLVNKLLVRK